MDAVVYDIEIVKGILSKDEDPIEGIEYCKGWHDHENMGISCICAYDFVEDSYRIFCEGNFHEFFQLVSNRSTLVTFNGIGFDNKVIKFYDKDNQMPISGHYDILREIWITLGLNPDKFYWKTHGGLGLDAMCQANGLSGKIGHGALAPVHWQQGKYGSVIDYCIQDVRMTRDLFMMSQEGWLKNPKGGEFQLRRV